MAGKGNAAEILEVLETIVYSKNGMDTLLILLFPGHFMEKMNTMSGPKMLRLRRNGSN